MECIDAKWKISVSRREQGKSKSRGLHRYTYTDRLDGGWENNGHGMGKGSTSGVRDRRMFSYRQL